MSNPSNSPAAKAKPVVQGVLFGNVKLKDILNGVVLEGSDLDSLLSADVHDMDNKHTGNVNESVPEKKVVMSDDDDDDDSSHMQGWHYPGRLPSLLREAC